MKVLSVVIASVWSMYDVDFRDCKQLHEAGTSKNSWSLWMCFCAIVLAMWNGRASSKKRSQAVCWSSGIDEFWEVEKKMIKLGGHSEEFYSACQFSSN